MRRPKVELNYCLATSHLFSGLTFVSYILYDVYMPGPFVTVFCFSAMGLTLGMADDGSLGRPFGRFLPRFLLTGMLARAPLDAGISLVRAVPSGRHSLQETATFFCELV